MDKLQFLLLVEKTSYYTFYRLIIIYNKETQHQIKTIYR